MDTNEIKSLVEQGNKTIEAIRAEVESVKSADVVSAEKLSKLEKSLAETLSAKSALEARIDAIETAANRPGMTKGSEGQDEYKDAFLASMRDPKNATKYDNAMVLATKADVFNTTTPEAGGLGVPVVIENQIRKTILEISPILSMVRNINVSTSDYRVISATDMDAGWVGEMDPRAETDAPTLAESRLPGGEVYANVRASNWSLADVAFDVEQFFIDAASEKFAEKIGAAVVGGDGVNKPLGILAATSGIPTVNTGSASTLGTSFDALISLPFGVKSAYRQNAAFVMNGATLATLAKVKDTAGNYLYQPSLAVGVPAALAGYRVIVDETMPNVAANSNSVVFGDLYRLYTLAHRTGLSVITDNVTNKGFTNFYISKRVMGKVVEPKAAVVLRTAV